jgi:hypothetical protein
LREGRILFLNSTRPGAVTKAMGYSFIKNASGLFLNAEFRMANSELDKKEVL